MAHAVVHDLEIVEIQEQDRGDGRPAIDREPGPNPIMEHRPVGQPGQRVVEGHVPELLLELRQLRERTLEMGVFQRGGGVVGDGVEEPQLVGVELLVLAHPIGDHDRSDQARVAPQRADHRMAEQAVERDRQIGARNVQVRRLLPPQALEEVDRLLHRNHHPNPIARANRRPMGDRRAFPIQEDQLGQVALEHLTSVLEQGDDRGVELG